MPDKGAPQDHAGAAGLNSRPVLAKICGLTRRKDAVAAAGAGADYLGAVLVPESPRCVTPEQAREITRGLGLPVVAVVADLPVREAAAAARIMGAAVLQLHGGETPEEVRALAGKGEWAVWKALRVRNRGDVEEGLTLFGPLVQGILLDGWHPHQKGGTGTAFSWQEVEEIRGAFPKETRLIAAGGLGPANVGEAIRRLRPDVVDVSSGVESAPGIKDHALMTDFIREVRRAEARETR